MSGCDYARSVLKHYLCVGMLEKVPLFPAVAKHHGFSVKVAPYRSGWVVHLASFQNEPTPVMWTPSRRIAKSVARALRFLGCRYEE
jgi:hypothetical protein